MTALWTSKDAEAATLGTASAPFAVTGLSIDSRTLKPGDLFIALKGEARDGHDFVGQAFAAGAAAALVQRAVEAEGPLLAVANTQRGLEDLARAARARARAQVVAVTGSAGKTTTKEMLRLAFGALGRTHASGASYNNHWGVPFSLAGLPENAEFGVFEVGMNHFGEIRALAGLVRPHAALVTTIAPAHLEFFESCEAIADAKSEIFEAIEPGGAALLPLQSPYADRLATRAHQARVGRILGFGRDRGDGRLVSLDEDGDGMKLEADILGRRVHARLGASGVHNAMNAVGALLAVAALDGDVLNAAAALTEFSALKGRGARRRLALGDGEIVLIDESYNANPASMAAALANLAASGARRRVAVMGDMLELGAQAPALHAGLAGAAIMAADLVFLCGPQMAALWQRLPAHLRGAYGATSKDIAEAVAAALADGDAVLIKGSLGSQMAVVVDALVARAA